MNTTKYTYVLNIPFMEKDIIKLFNGTRYDPINKVNTITTTKEEFPKELIKYLSTPFSHEIQIEKNINNIFRSDIQELFDTYKNNNNKLIPRNYQNEAFKLMYKSFVLKNGGFLLADEVGLGKTISACLMGIQKEFKSILVVTTLSAIPHWRDTMLNFKEFFNKDIIITNYDKLPKLLEIDNKKLQPAKNAKTIKRKTKNKKIVKHGEAPSFDLVIFDESHKLKNSTSNRSKIGLKIIENANFTIYLSATAGQNPLELSYLRFLLAKATGDDVKQLADFEKWCQKEKLGIERGDFGKWIWDKSPESIKKINNMLFNNKNPIALRRLPSDLEGFPEINRILTPLEMDIDNKKDYELYWKEFKKEIIDNDYRSYKNNSKNKKDSLLVQQLRFRQKASYLKIPQTVETTLDLLENNCKVAISVLFKETLREIKEKLEAKGINVCYIDGSLSPKEKEEQRLLFQKGEAMVCLFTVVEAISLHEGQYLENDLKRITLIHDIRWTAIEISQIEGRCHRDKKFSQIYWLYLKDSIEEKICQILLNKVIAMKGILGDDTTELEKINELFFY